MYQLTVFIIFITSHMVQSAPLSHDQRIHQQANDITTMNIKISFYCAAKSFTDKAGVISGKKYISLESNDTSDKTKLQQLFNHFSEGCKNFTKAMSLKHQLQDYLFSQDGSSLTTKETKQVYSILVGLQMTANILDQYLFS